MSGQDLVPVGNADQQFGSYAAGARAGGEVPLSLDFPSGPISFTIVGERKRPAFAPEELTMGIFSRARDIIQANVSDLLDRAEDPAKTIRLVIMEMEETLVEVRASAARTIADQKEMRRTILKLEQAQSNWAEKAELALSKDREDLATAALTEKQKVAQTSVMLRSEVDALEETLRAHEDDISKLEAKLREARTRQNALISRLESAQNRARVRAMTRGARVEDAFSRFELLERRVDMAEGRAEVYDLAPVPKSLEEEISELRSNDAVATELAELKARMQQKH
jgi:phage shock protein A